MEKISFYDFSVVVSETDKTISDVQGENVIDITDFKEFNIKLNEWQGNLQEFKNYVGNQKLKS